MSFWSLSLLQIPISLFPEALTGYRGQAARDCRSLSEGSKQPAQSITQSSESFILGYVLYAASHPATCKAQLGPFKEAHVNCATFPEETTRRAGPVVRRTPQNQDWPGPSLPPLITQQQVPRRYASADTSLLFLCTPYTAEARSISLHMFILHSL